MMSRRRVLAAGFKHHGRDPLSETELVAAIALERGWLSPDEVRALIDQAQTAGELTGTKDALSPTYDVGQITIPSGYSPPDGLLDPPSPFERVVDRLEAAGHEKRDAVAAINRLQTDACLTIDAAAVLYARGQGIDVATEAGQVRHAIEMDQQ